MFFASLMAIIIFYGVCLGYIAGEAHDQCGGIEKCLESGEKPNE